MKKRARLSVHPKPTREGRKKRRGRGAKNEGREDK